MKKTLKSNLQGVLIDFDGTLVDSIQDLYSLYCNFLHHYKKKGTLAEFKELNGPSLHEIIELLIQRHQLPDPSEKLLALYSMLLLEYYKEVAQPAAGALDFIHQVKKRGVKLILVTSADSRLVEPFLNRCNLKDVFDVVVTSEGLQRSKPDPAIYRAALAKANLDPQQAIAIEDSLKGLQSALGAGIYTFRLNPRIKARRRHQGWIEVKNWKEISQAFVEAYV
jgi:HAD superfamily hydrolase (TIGR01509 family)